MSNTALPGKPLRAIVTQSLDPSWPKWGCVTPSQFHLTRWYDTRAKAQIQADIYNQDPNNFHTPTDPKTIKVKEVGPIKRHYAIFNATNGGLVGNLRWDAIQDIYATCPDSVRAIYRLKRTGRAQVRWICTGLDANARENVQELDRLNAVRKATGLDPINLGNLS